MADTRLSDLSAAGALSASDLFYVVQTPGSGGEKATGTQLLTLVGTTYVPLAGGTMTGALTIASGTLTASAPALNITQTWTTGAAFTGLLMNITDTSSTPGSLFQNWQVAGVSKASLNKSGVLIVESIATGGGVTGNGGAFNYYLAGMRNSSIGEVAWTSGTVNATMDLALYRDAAATLAQRNGTNQQIFRLYNSYTDSSNFERLTLTGVAGTSVNITAETLGTGGDNLDIVLTPAGTGNVKFGTHSAIAAETVTGYITIKDSGGTTRKLAVVS